MKDRTYQSIELTQGFRAGGLHHYRILGKIGTYLKTWVIKHQPHARPISFVLEVL